MHLGTAVMGQAFCCLGFASRLQPLDYGTAVFILFPVLAYTILGMRTGLTGLRCGVLQYGTVLFAGLLAFLLFEQCSIFMHLISPYPWYHSLDCICLIVL